MNLSLRIFAALILPLVFCFSTFAQRPATETAVHVHPGGQPVAFCGTDFARLYDVQLALNQRQPTRRMAARHARVDQDPPEIGDERQFRTTLNGPLSTYVLRDKSDLHYAWVAKGELAHVTDDLLAELHTALAERTPDGSVNPDQGIIANLHELFGQPPNYDGDGLLDVLFFYRGESPGGGTDVPEVNNADVLFLNSRGWEFFPDLLPAVAAHEYTHLIHINYQNLGDLERNLFIAEGLADYAIRAMGYQMVSDAPLFYYRSASELARPLFQFRPRSNPSFRQDYWRAGLFHLYLADHFGPAVMRDILQHSVNAQGGANYRSVLAPYGITLEDVVTDFHLANYLNDRTIDSRFGYSTPGFADFRGRDHPAAFIRYIDGSTTTFTDMTEIGIGPGAVQYFVWDDVANFAFTANTTRPELLRLRTVLEREDGTIEVDEDMESGTTSFSGSYDRIAVAAIHADPENLLINVEFSATWDDVSTDIDAVTQVPAPFTLESTYPNPFTTTTTLRYRVGRGGPVVLAIFDVLGRHVATLVDETATPGEHAVVWDGRDGGSAPVAAGVYLARLRAGRAVQSRTLLLLK